MRSSMHSLHPMYLIAVNCSNLTTTLTKRNLWLRIYCKKKNKEKSFIFRHKYSKVLILTYIENFTKQHCAEGKQ